MHNILNNNNLNGNNKIRIIKHHKINYMYVVYEYEA